MNGQDNGSAPRRLVRSTILGANGSRMTYEGPPVEIVDVDDAAACGLRIAVLFEPKESSPVIGAMRSHPSTASLAMQEPARPILGVWRIPAESSPSVLKIAAVLVLTAQKKGDAVRAVIVDDGEHAWWFAAAGIAVELAPVRKTIEAMLRAEPDAPRVLARL